MFRRLIKRPSSPPPSSTITSHRDHDPSSSRERGKPIPATTTTIPTTPSHSQKLPWPLETIRGSMDTMRSGNGEFGRDVPDHAYSPLFTSGLHPSHLSPTSPSRQSISLSRKRPQRPPRPDFQTPNSIHRTPSSNSPTGGGPLTPIDTPTHTISSPPTSMTSPSESTRLGNTKHQRPKKRRSSNSISLVGQLKKPSPSSPVKGRREKGVEVGKESEGWDGWESGVWMMNGMEGQRGEEEVGEVERANSLQFPTIPTLTTRLPPTFPNSPPPLPAPTLSNPSTSNTHNTNHSLHKRSSKPPSSPLRPFRFKALLSRSSSRLISTSTSSSLKEDKVEILEDVVVIIERKSTALETPTEPFRSSVIRGQSVDLERLNRQLPSVEVGRVSPRKSSLGSVGTMRKVLAPLDVRKVGSFSPLRPMSRTGTISGRASPALKEKCGKEDHGMGMVEEVTAHRGMFTSTALLHLPPPPPPPSSTIPPPIITDEQPPSSPVSPTTSVRTFGHPIRSQISTTPTFKLTRPEEPDAFPFPHQSTPVKMDMEEEGNEIPDRERTRSGAFEFQTFESGMEEDDKETTTAAVQRRISKQAALRHDKVLGSPPSNIKRTGVRPESGLLPLQLVNRSPLRDRTNHRIDMSTPPRSNNKVTTSKYSPYHLSPPAPLRIATRKSSRVETMKFPRVGENRTVDWGLEDEFASLEIAMDIGDE